MILLWGSSRDGPLRAACAALRSRAAPFLFADQSPAHELRVTFGHDGILAGRIATDGGSARLSDVHAAYLRPLDWRRVTFAETEAHAGKRSTWIRGQDALWIWADVTKARVVNRPEAMNACSSKPFQLSALVASGFAVPATLITTDPSAAKAFWSSHGEVVYKSISSTRSIVSRLTSSHRERLDDLSHCPVQLQEFIPGTDFRVHVVGDSLFCSSINSDADDYRYAAAEGANVDVRPSPLPEDCAGNCRALAARLGLRVAGIDLRLAPTGEWYCFEINPSPAFTFYEVGGEPYSIASALAELLDE